MISFLLAWNPRRAPWPERHELLRKLCGGRQAATRWGLRTRAVKPGDILFFIRLGMAPKGIFARASALSPAYRNLHWDPRKRAKGKTSWYVDLEFGEMIDVDREPPLDLATLSRPPLDEFHWMIQGSGTFVPDRIARALDSEWREHLARIGR